ncbi:MAG: DUF1289 domain-containing protein [Polyangiaceae bacterium]|nr:DUF1289 domain-containing protein [Polyangiaceae bacterium]
MLIGYWSVLAKKRESPCIDVCEFTGPNGWCVGCGRTRGECKKWKDLKPYAQRTLESALRKRMLKMADSK